MPPAPGGPPGGPAGGHGAGQPGPPPAISSRLGGQLHRSAIPIWASQQVVGLVVLVIFGGGPGGFGLLLAGAALAVTAVASVIRWNRFRWSIEAGNLIIEQGLVQRSRRVIPADRVQSVDLVRPVRHRLLGVVQVRIEAIGGRDSEGVLEALDESTAFAIQHALVGARAARRQQGQASAPVGHASAAEPDGTTASPNQPRHLATVAPRDLVVAGLTGGRVGVIALIVGGLQQVIGDQVSDVFSRVPADLGLLTIVLFAVAALVLIFLLSIAATVVTYWGFTVMRDDDELRISRGLLEQRLETVPIARIQSLRIEQNLLRRLLGVASVKADLAGRVGGGEDTGTGLLLPIGPVEDARRLVADLLGNPAPVAAMLTPPPARSRRRYLVRGLVPGFLLALLTAPIAVLGGPVLIPLAAAVVGGAVGVPLALSWWSALGSGEVDGVLVSRTGLLVRRRVHVPVGRVQRLSLRSTPFQRRLALADVRIGIARSGGWEGPRMPELDRDHALALAAHLAALAGPSR